MDPQIKKIADKNVAEAANNLPDIEVENLKKATQVNTVSDEQTRFMLAYCRLVNPCCNYCRQKDNISVLELCDCKLVWYCRDKDCKNQDRNIHKDWCCNRKATDIDRGPMMTAVISVKK